MSSSPAVQKIASKAKEVSRLIAVADTATKNNVLQNMASLLEKFCEDIVQANNKDLNSARKNGIAEELYERLRFDESKVRSRIVSLKKIAALPDPVGQIFEQQKTANGLMIGRMKVPLGVLLMIYEARPHVTVNAGAFALKSGNAIICKGGSEAQNCNALLGKMWVDALELAGLPGEAIQVVSLKHAEVDELLTMQDDIDLVIPRGGKNLIRSVAEKSRIPVVKHFEGVNHVYIGDKADMDKALQIVLDSKLLMPAVCNAAETVLFDDSLRTWMPFFLKTLDENGIKIHGCPSVCQQLQNAVPATEEDWYAEYLDKTYAVKVVDGIDDAIEHITRYGSGHTDVIVTENYSHAQKFVNEVDSSVVLVNASTMFCDGETLGMGAEIGISTDKFHARGPMGLNELTSYKHVILGGGQIMGPAYQIPKISS
jgi:glutamate-5-semialdehyde dehydrogenase